MDLSWLTGVSGVLVAVGGLALTLWRTRSDIRMGVSADDATTRRDTVADRDALIDQLQEQGLRHETRLTAVESELVIERRWNRMLVDHIYRELPPPPPERPN